MTPKPARPRILLLGLILGMLSLIAAISYQLYLNYAEELTARLTPDVIVVHDIYSSMYLVRCDSGFIAFDTALNSTVVRRGLQYNGIRPEEVRGVFITHSDFEHQNTVDLFKNARMYYSADEVAMVQAGTPRFAYLPFIRNKITARAYGTLHDDDDIVVGNRRIRCVSLPGHTTGSMGFIVDGKYLFSGDAFRLKNGRVEEPRFKFFVMDLQSLRASIRKASHLPNIRYVFTGHTGFTADPVTSFEKWR